MNYIGKISVLAIISMVLAGHAYGHKEVFGKAVVDQYCNSTYRAPQDMKTSSVNHQSCNAFEFPQDDACVYMGTFNSDFYEGIASDNNSGLSSTRIAIWSDEGFAFVKYMQELESKQLSVIQSNIKRAIADVYAIKDWYQDKDALYSALEKQGVQIFIASCGFRLKPTTCEKLKFRIVPHGIVANAIQNTGTGAVDNVMVAVFQGQGSPFDGSEYKEFDQFTPCRLTFKGNKPEVSDIKEILAWHPSKVTTFYTIVISPDKKKIVITHVLLDADDFVLPLFSHAFNAGGFSYAMSAMDNFVIRNSSHSQYEREWSQHEWYVCSKALNELGTLGDSSQGTINRTRNSIDFKDDF